jgi:hypothetical protein
MKKTKVKLDNLLFEISGISELTSSDKSRLIKSFDQNVSKFLKFALIEFGLQVTNLTISIDMERDPRQSHVCTA